MQNRRETPTVLAAINVDVTEFHAPLVGFGCDVCSKMLSESSFSCTHVTGQDDSLSHFFGAPQDEVEEFHEEAVLRFAVWQLLRNVVYVKLGFVFENALMRRHLHSSRYSVLFFG